MFSYNPISAQQAEAARKFPMLEPGEYDFQVKKACYRLSKSNNPMIELTVSVWDKQGKEFTIFDYLISTEKMGWKTRHFCEAVGLEKEYEDRSFNELLCQDKCGKVLITIQKGKPKPDGGLYPDKNVIDDYLKEEKENKTINSIQPKSDPYGFDSEIPF